MSKQLYNLTDNLKIKDTYKYKDILLPYASVPSDILGLNAKQVRHMDDIVVEWERKQQGDNGADAPTDLNLNLFPLPLDIDEIMKRDYIDKEGYGSIITACCRELNIIDRDLMHRVRLENAPERKRTRRESMSLVQQMLYILITRSSWVITTNHYTTLCILCKITESTDRFLCQNLADTPTKVTFNTIKRLIKVADDEYTCVLIGGAS